MAIRSGYILYVVALAVLLAGLLSFLLPERAFACSPRPIGSPLEELERNNSVFRGKATSSSWSNGETMGESTVTTVMWEFTVTTVWKGPLAEKRTIISRYFQGSCDRKFSIDEEYVVYSFDGEGVGFSSRTSLISEAAEDLAELVEGQKPIPGTVLPVASADEENGGGCGIAPNTVDLSIVGLLIGIAWLGFGRRRSHRP